MTKKEYERKIFNPAHQKDYGPWWLQVPAIIGCFILVSWIILAYMQDTSLRDTWDGALRGKPMWTLLYVFCIICLIIEVIFKIKRYLDLDSEYKANMMSLAAVGQSFNSAPIIKKPNFCASCGKAIGNKSWNEGYCEFCGKNIISGKEKNEELYILRKQ